ncbi:MAG: RtcB family protein [Anaerolineae bacterium]
MIHSIQQLDRISDYVWQIPTSFRKDMNVPARIYATETLMEKATEDRSLEQLVNATTLPGLVGYALAMPDFHQGYGFPVGGVLASRTADGIISPGIVGYDINCGVRVLASNIPLEAAADQIERLNKALFRNCPTGVGRGGGVQLREREFENLLHKGGKWAVKAGYALPQDIDRTESSGRLPFADVSHVSSKAFERGITQLGTLGAGNHFIEVDVIDAIYDEEAAAAMGLELGYLVVLIHTGSRGFGHQVTTDYLREFQSAVKEYGIELVDRQLVCVPFDSSHGRAYYGAMNAAGNFAFMNRQVLAWRVRKTFDEVLKDAIGDTSLHQVYDIAHNIAKVETHEVNGEDVEVVVHRKGATRAFGPGFRELPKEYRDIGQPVLVPGSMGTSSWILAGTATSMSQTFGSSCHGAGRVMSRTQAKKSIRGGELRDELEIQGVSVQAGSLKGLAEEAPAAYKDVDQVVETVHHTGIARQVARLTPVAVVKG